MMRLRRHITAVLAAVLTVTAAVSLSAQRQGRFLAKEDIILLRRSACASSRRTRPCRKTSRPSSARSCRRRRSRTRTLPPFAPDAVVKAHAARTELRAAAGPRPRAEHAVQHPAAHGRRHHTLDNIRLVSGGEVLLRGVARERHHRGHRAAAGHAGHGAAADGRRDPRERHRLRQSNFQAYNFTAAFAVARPADQHQLPGPPAARSRARRRRDGVDRATIPAIDPPALPSLQTIIPDTLQAADAGSEPERRRLHAAGARAAEGQDFVVPPIPGVIVIPGDIGFLNQLFSVMLMVGNVAPDGSNLVVTRSAGGDRAAAGQRHRRRIAATIRCAMAQTASGETPRVQPIVAARRRRQARHRRRHRIARPGRDRQRRVPRRRPARRQPRRRDGDQRHAERPAGRSGPDPRPRRRLGARPQPDLHADVHASRSGQRGRAVHARRHRDEHVAVAGQLRQPQPATRATSAAPRSSARRRSDDREHPAWRLRDGQLRPGLAASPAR